MFHFLAQHLTHEWALRQYLLSEYHEATQDQFNKVQNRVLDGILRSACVRISEVRRSYEGLKEERTLSCLRVSESVERANYPNWKSNIKY